MSTLEEIKAEVTTEIEESKPLYVGTSMVKLNLLMKSIPKN